MRVILAKTAGFCMGVKRAMQVALDTARDRGPVTTCGPLVHNPQAVAALAEQGVTASDAYGTLAAGTLIIRAHGMPVDELDALRERGLELVDATCPHVQASQRRIREHVAAGAFVVIVGDRDHPEIKSLASYAPNRHVVVASVAEVAAIALEGEPRVIVIAQTTFGAKAYDEIAAAVQQRAPQCEVFNSICRATSSRQEEVLLLARQVDAVVVVGGRNSANTCRLAELAAGTGKPTVHVETAAELDLAILRQYNVIGVTAGASTPTWITAAVVETLEKL